jgi:hypothetical protein
MKVGIDLMQVLQGHAPADPAHRMGKLARDVEVEALTDDERVRLLKAGAADERAGRLVHCETASEVRDLLIGPARPPA